jgi:hypothetical protein
MNLAEIEATLPWGLHDAYLEGIEIDWLTSTASLLVRVMMTERQDQDQRAKITVSGLAFCAMDPPDPRRQNEDSSSADGLWLGSGEGPANDTARQRLPEVPGGCFLHWLFVNQWNSFIHISGREAHLEWLEPHPVAARSDSRALFPGEEM